MAVSALSCHCPHCLADARRRELEIDRALRLPEAELRLMIRCGELDSLRRADPRAIHARARASAA